jgi:hypothetical protein
MLKKTLKAIILLLVLPVINLANQQTPTGISPEAYGVVVGAGQPAAVRAANFTALNNCVQAAISSHQPVILPANTIEMDLPNLGCLDCSAIQVNGTLEIRGTDRALSKIKCGPESPTYHYSAFHAAPFSNLTITDSTIEGPANPGPNGYNNFLTTAIRQIGAVQDASGFRYDCPGSVILQRVNIAGEFFNGIIGDHGDVLLELTDCDLTGYIQAVAWHAAFNTGKRVIARNTYFHDAGLTATAADPKPRGHLFYPSPCVSLDLDNCRFGGNHNFAIHHYGSSNLAPQFVKINNCTFESTCHDAIETTGSGFTEITNCTFNNANRGVTLKGPALVTDSVFNGPTGVSTFDSHSNYQLSILRCRFERVTGVGIATTFWSQCNWTVLDCSFSGASPSAIAIGDGGIGSNMYLSNCTFSGTWGRGIHAVFGNYFLNGCTFSGSYSAAAVQHEDYSGTVNQIQVDNCNFLNTGQSVWGYLGASGVISGSGNQFSVNQPMTSTAGYHRLKFRRAVAPNTLTSGSMLAPNFNYDSYRVSGSAAINNIRVGGMNEVDRMCSDRLVLIADGSWSLTNTGNIRPLHTGARAVGSTATLIHDPQTNIWSEVVGSSSPPAPTMAAVSPNSGTTAGGTSVTITGTGFSSSLTVHFGGVSATNINVTSSTSLTVTTPSHTAGTVDVQVINSDGQSGTLIGGYTYIQPPPPPPDTEAPTITITSPMNKARVTGTVAVNVQATDNVAVVKVELYVNGRLEATSTTAPFTIPWNTTPLAPGSYKLRCKAYDAAGNVGTSAMITLRK